MRKIFVSIEVMDFIVNELPSYDKWFTQWVNVKYLDDLNSIHLGDFVMLTDSIRVETVRVHGISAIPCKDGIIPMIAVRL